MAIPLSKSAPKVPEGLHLGVCSGVIHLGTQTKTFNGKVMESYQLLLLFEVPIAGEDQLASISIETKMSLHSQATLYKLLTGWFGKKYFDKLEEAKKDFEEKDLLGKGVYINVSESKSENGKVYSKINALSPLPAGIQPPAPSKLLFYNLEGEIPDELPDWIKNNIKKSIEWKKAHGEVIDSEEINTLLNV